MELPEEMPNELKSIFNKWQINHSLFIGIYNDIKNYFNNQPTVWNPVSENPKHLSTLWVWDGLGIYSAIFFHNKFMSNEVENIRPTHWTYAYVPQPPKKELTNDRP